MDFSISENRCVKPEPFFGRYRQEVKMFNYNFITARDVVTVAVANLAGRDCEVSTHKRGNIYVLDGAVRYYNSYELWCAVDIDAAHHATRTTSIHTDEVIWMREVISQNFILRDYKLNRKIHSEKGFEEAVQKCIDDIRKCCTKALYELRNEAA